MKKHTTRLQGMGICEGIQAKDLKVGDVTVWNNGFEETILSIEMSKTGKTMKCSIGYNFMGEAKTAERKMTSSRIVVVK